MKMRRCLQKPLLEEPCAQTLSGESNQSRKCSKKSTRSKRSKASKKSTR